MTKYQIMQEIAATEAKINSPESRGKLTALKAYHRKLCAAYHKAAA
jgi:hypothetical protein